MVLCMYRFQSRQLHILSALCTVGPSQRRLDQFGLYNCTFKQYTHIVLLPVPRHVHSHSRQSCSAGIQSPFRTPLSCIISIIIIIFLITITFTFTLLSSLLFLLFSSSFLLKPQLSLSIS